MRFAKKQNPVKIVVEIKTLPRYVRSQLITYISMIGCEDHGSMFLPGSVKA